MKVRFIGQKGIPAVFGGVEYHVERLAEALVRRGHDVSAYVRPWYTPPGLAEHDGVRLLRLPTIRTKHADASVHSFLAAAGAAFSDADIVHFHAIGPGAFSVLTRLAGKKTVVTVHRLDWKTEKWGPAARLLLRSGEWISTRAPQATIVVSSELQAYFKEKYGKETSLIPHGRVVPVPSRPGLIRRRYGLKGRDYVLFMGRFSPEKRVDWLIRSFREAKRLRPAAFRGLKLVLAGGSSETPEVESGARDLARGEPGILFPGNVTGAEKSELWSNARLFVLPSSLEGLPVVLLEARAYGLACLASDIPAHREVLRPGRDGLLFSAGDREDLTGKLIRLVEQPALAARLGRAAAARSAGLVGWDEVARRHEELYERVLGRPKGGNR
jgi:glycosyltransferase involved in cell wall biosynthesis